MRLIVTGGAGFIGSHLCDLLIKKKNVDKIIVIDHLQDGTKKNLKNALKSKKIILFKYDIRNKKKILPLFKSVDVVIHLAALSDIVPSITDPENYLSTNIVGTMNVLESMRFYNVKKIIYAASSSCYGIPKKYPTKENESIDTRYPYAFSKNIGEQLIQHWSKVYNINYISLRLFNVYGTRSRTHGAYGAALGIFLRQKISGKAYTIVGDGNQKRDFVYVSDVCNAFFQSIISKKRNLILNIGYGKPHSVNYLTKLLGGPKIFIPKRPSEPDITHADIKRAIKFIKWRPKITLEEGIDIVVKNIDYWKKAPLWTPKKISKATKNWFKYLK
jgi:UDP-glucose 4-epimerase